MKDYKSNVTAEQFDMIPAIIDKVFPLEITSVSGGGTYEKGQSKSNVVISWVLTKDPTALKVNDVSEDVKSRSKTFAGPYTENATFTVKATDSKGTTLSKSTSISFSNYRYHGSLGSTMPSDIAQAIYNLGSTELSTTTTYSGTTTKDEYYLFAVAGNVTLKGYTVDPSGNINGCVTGTCSVKRRNDNSKTDTYSYIILPKFSGNQKFEIKNA